MSIFIYAGSMQFVAVALISSGFNIIGTIFITLMINARHLFYGLSMLSRFHRMGKFKPYMIFSLTDETYSLLVSTEAPKDVDANWFYFFLSLLNHCYWILGSALGGILGSIITFNTKGIDFVMTALFVVIFINQWKSTSNHRPALIGVIISILCLLIFKADNFIIPSMIGILLILSYANKPIGERK